MKTLSGIMLLALGLALPQCGSSSAATSASTGSTGSVGSSSSSGSSGSTGTGGATSSTGGSSGTGAATGTGGGDGGVPPPHTSFYVDPAFMGATRGGTQSQPWQSLSDGSAWSAINAALATGSVEVFFSATGSSTVALGLGKRTDASTNMLTLDGISMKNDSATSPSWTTNVVPSPCKYDAAGCAWASASRFTITANTPVAGSDSPTDCKSYFTIQGFTLKNTEGQSADLSYTAHIVFQYNDVSRVATGSYGPGVYIGPANKGPGCGGAGPDDVTVQYNHIHETWGECLYVGASTPDPPGGPGSAEYTMIGLTCDTACSTGANYVIRGNVNESCASWGGQGDGMDIKDGHANLLIVNNTLRPTKPCTSCGTNGPGADGQGIVVESATVIDGNYVEAPGHEGIAIFDSWNNSVGRGGIDVRNNIVVNITSGVGHNFGIEMQPPQAGAAQLWAVAGIYNNSIFMTNDACIGVDAGNGTTFASVQNNVMTQCGGGGLSAGAGTLAAHDDNDYFDITGSAIAYGGTFACASVSSSEAHSLCVDPKFVSTATPYADLGFKLQAGSGVAAAGTTLSAFTDDYFGATRTAPWSMGVDQP